ncbi:UDP-4-amino-4,6-dideoxy-N-acetyl-beta-L-altrosamine transaminase [Synechococcus sp. PCC 6716]|nr:UDP-4-amino-4,6-dideoxy-N-acetyl-beta-L-altrosamine transaminase [Synechococcus sp. PCC 6716]
MDYIPYGRHDITPADIEAVIAVLKSDWLTQGPQINAFETALAQYCGAKYAVAVSSATAALHLACLAAGLGCGDTLWTSPITFVASANCGLYCGAKVDFVDIDPHTYNLSVSALEQKLAIAAQRGTLPKVLIPVHLAGQSCEMAPIAALAQRYGITVIEDASHGIGGQYQGNPIGNCQYSTMTVFSFHPVKIMTTGEGGAILTNEPEIYQRLLRLRTHGITREPQQMIGHSHGPWYYQQLDLGYNYRLSDLHAALGCSQLQRLGEFVAQRQFLAQRYNQFLGDLPLTLPAQHGDTASSWHLYIIRLKLDQIGCSHREVFEALRAAGIGVNLHYIPVHTQPYYQQLGFRWGEFPAAEAYYREAISLPLYYGLTVEQQDYIIQVLRTLIP